MTKDELEKDYYADRPTEPYCDDDSPNDWANIAHYAEENLEKAFKRIAELGQQIEQNKIDLAISEHDREHNDYELTEVYTKVEQLEKENAELKEDNSEWEKASDKWKSLYESTNNQLTNAKELLKQWLQTTKASGCDNINIVADTEQFLNDFKQEE